LRKKFNVKADNHSPWQTTLYHLLLVVIVAVSVHDGFLVLLNRGTIARDEQNPLGRWLIDLNEGGIRYILAAKFVGTIAVATVMLILFRKRRRMAWVICTVIATGQIILALYLTFF